MSTGLAFGHNPPWSLMGWRGIDEERRDRDALYGDGLLANFSDLSLEDEDKLKEKYIPIWDLQRELFGGKLIPTHRQETGDCVAEGATGTCQELTVWQITQEHKEQRYRPIFSPYYYATGRNQILGGMSGAGSTGAAMAKAINKYGTLFSDDEGVPKYSGALADKWGHRRNAGPIEQAEYAEFAKIAHDNPANFVRLTTVEEIARAILSGIFPTIASSRGFKMKCREEKGFHCFVPSGTWMHQMRFSAVMYDPFFAFYRMNTWGPDAHGPPLNGELPGGGWNHAEDVEKELKGRDVEVYGFYLLKAEPGEADEGGL